MWTSLEPFGVWGWSFFRWYTQKIPVISGVARRGAWRSIPECEDLVNFSDFLLTDRWPGPEKSLLNRGPLGEKIPVKSGVASCGSVARSNCEDLVNFVLRFC